MKKLTVVFILFLINCVAKAQDTVGDIKYSILAPDKFIDKHPGWILLDGRNIAGSTLANDYGIVDIPDARGVFIRAMNVGRDVTKGDADGNRVIGAPQQDLVKMHFHSIPDAGAAGPNAGFVFQYNQNHFNSIVTSDALSSEAIQKQRGLGAETRPRNITLYLYIKVN